MIPDDAMVALLTDELHVLLTREGLVEGVNLLLRRQDARILVHHGSLRQNSWRSARQPFRPGRTGRPRQPHPPNHA